MFHLNQSKKLDDHFIRVLHSLYAVWWINLKILIGSLHDSSWRIQISHGKFDANKKVINDLILFYYVSFSISISLRTMLNAAEINQI